ncbi:hypothetical protein GPECTOR_2g1265 [Gonium pectorale]|uniref:WLM domain-containing protein n=1 Tax=Gonium pectorale TaxID=33097 RepID=A0A150H0W6_GONPE|nr:hypothetical protein GPECTOR_2g1265 [Gonium pectorale]|eukprot:KXZ55715.1 hypothetical protein GPECTOR_2g1265 [Gonium pectorale]
MGLSGIPTPAGLSPGSKALLVASRAEDVVKVRASRELTGIRGFDDELKRAARRRRTAATSAASLRPPTAEYTFGDYKTWDWPGLRPPPGEAMKLLYRLANDPGILGVMAAHRYKVGLLSEMPPEGRVGVSPMCILGVNINAGQEISLRLRTDDLKGFRKYERIRETLIHELAHMEFGEHGLDFKQLNSQLGRECEAINARYSGGRSLLDDVDSGAAADGAASELDAAWLLEDANDVMAATARLSGRTLRQLAADSAGGAARAPAASNPAGGAARTAAAAGGRPGAVAPVALPLPARVAAAAAALSRGITARPAHAGDEAAPAQAPSLPAAQGPAAGGRPGALHGSGAGLQAGPEAGGRGTPGTGSGEPSSHSTSSGDEEPDSGDATRRFEHFDADTDRAEAEARRLGSLELEEPCTKGGAADGDIPMRDAADGDGGAAAAPKGVGAIRGVDQEGTANVGRQPLGSLVELHAAEAEAATAMLKAPAGPGEVAGAALPAPGHGDSVTHGSAAGARVLGGAAPVPLQPPAPKSLPPLVLVVSPPGDLSESAGGDSGMGDVVREKVRRAWAAAAQLVGAASRSAKGGPAAAIPAHAAGPALPGPSACGPSPHAAHGGAAAPLATPDDVLLALDTLDSMLGNAANFPREERYRRVRLGNAALQRRLGRLPGGLELLRVAGFVQEVAGAEGEGEVLRLRRDDPGLLWLVLSVVREVRDQVAAQVAAARDGREWADGA